jgi:hypothetical protein
LFGCSWIGVEVFERRTLPITTPRCTALLKMVGQMWYGCFLATELKSMRRLIIE